MLHLGIKSTNRCTNDLMVRLFSGYYMCADQDFFVSVVVTLFCCICVFLHVLCRYLAPQGLHY